MEMAQQVGDLGGEGRGGEEKKGEEREGEGKGGEGKGGEGNEEGRREGSNWSSYKLKISGF